jgi:hypothetical protein
MKVRDIRKELYEYLVPAEGMFPGTLIVLI